MGLFKRRQDNFTLIADNVIAFYMVLRDNFQKSFRREQILFAAGLMDIIMYLEQGTIAPNEIAKAVFVAKKGEISMGGRKITHARKSEDEDMSKYDPNEEELLVNFIMQLECVIMSIKRRGNPGLVLNVVSSKKDVIEKTVKEGLAQGKDHKFYAGIEQQAKEWFVEPNMSRAVSGFKI